MICKKNDFKESLRQQIEDNVNNKDRIYVKDYFDKKKIEGVSFYKIKEENLIDIIPYIVKTKNHSKKLEIGSGDYVLEIYTHNNIGIENKEYLCLQRMFGKSCPVCEEMYRYKEEGEEESEKKLWPRHRTLYNVIDLDEEEKGIQIFDVTFNWIEKNLRMKARKGEELVTFADLEEGSSIDFVGELKTYTRKGKIIEYKEPVALKFVSREEQYDEDILLKESYSLDSLLYVPSYQELYDIYYAIEKKEESEESNVRIKKFKKKKEESKEEVEEESKEEVSTRIKKFKKKKEKKSCPHGNDFGLDYDEYDECKDCFLKKECSLFVNL